MDSGGRRARDGNESGEQGHTEDRSETRARPWLKYRAYRSSSMGAAYHSLYPASARSELDPEHDAMIVRTAGGRRAVQPALVSIINPAWGVEPSIPPVKA